MMATGAVSGDEPQEGFLARFLAYAAGLAMLLATSAGPTATVLASLLRAVGLPVVQEGTVLHVGDLPPQWVTLGWSAAPVVLIGYSVILARPAGSSKQFGGFFLVALNAWLVNLLTLGLLAQTQAELRGAFMVQLYWAYPLLMAFVLAVTLSYWARRVVPGAKRVGHARELLDPSTAEAGADG